MPLISLSLGSNRDARRSLSLGLAALEQQFGELQVSPVFESEPVGISSGPFFNLVVSGETDLTLAELDQRLKLIEADNGRYAPGRKGLPLDIDVLLYGQQVGDFDGLILPRAEILKNAFVLWPLALHAPQVLHPGVQRSFADLWQTAQIAQQLQPIAFQWRGHELTPSELILAHSGA